jgi:hypothetical protein
LGANDDRVMKVKRFCAVQLSWALR